jgi:hypothetical protein
MLGRPPRNDGLTYRSSALALSQLACHTDIHINLLCQGRSVVDDAHHWKDAGDAEFFHPRGRGTPSGCAPRARMRQGGDLLSVIPGSARLVSEGDGGAMRLRGERMSENQPRIVGTAWSS